MTGLIIGILVIMACVLALLTGGFYWLSRPGHSNAVSVFLYRMMNKTNRQPVIHIGEDGIVRKADYRIDEPGYIVDKKKDRAWHLVHSLNFNVQKQRRRFLVLTDRNTIPFNPFVTIKPSKMEKIRNLESIADLNSGNVMAKAARNGRNNIVAMGLTICVCAVVFAFLVYTGVNAWQNGGIKMPFFGG